MGLIDRGVTGRAFLHGDRRRALLSILQSIAVRIVQVAVRLIRTRAPAPFQGVDDPVPVCVRVVFVAPHVETLARAVTPHSGHVIRSRKTEQIVRGSLIARAPVYTGGTRQKTVVPVLRVYELGVEVSVSNFQGGSGAAWYLIDDSRAIKPMIFQDREAAKITPKTNLTDDNVFFQDEFVWGAKRRCAAGFGAWQLVYASRQTLNAANYALARAAMLAMRGHKGRKLNLKPKLLVVPPSLEGAAREILLNERDSSGATNKWRNTAELHVEGRLTL